MSRLIQCMSNQKGMIKRAFAAFIVGLDVLVFTINSKIFARVLFFRNFAYAKFRENEILANWRNHSVVY